MDIIIIISIIYLITLIIFATIIVLLIHRCYNYSTQSNKYKGTTLYYKSLLSMIEYHHRNYMEGDNPISILNKIKEILNNIDRSE